MEKYSPEIKLQAMGMWAEGKSFREIAAHLKLKNFRTVQRWKLDKYPENWESYRAKMRQKEVMILEEKALEEFSRAQVRHQKYLREAQERLIGRISRSTDSEIDISDAVTELPHLIEAERSVYLPLQSSDSQSGKGNVECESCVRNSLMETVEANFQKVYPDLEKR